MNLLIKFLSIQGIILKKKKVVAFDWLLNIIFERLVNIFQNPYIIFNEYTVSIYNFGSPRDIYIENIGRQNIDINISNDINILLHNSLWFRSLLF